MDCNKDEAIMVKGIAENKMQNNDFAGARKFALKAQNLYQDLENISQMISVCDVHCSAEKKLFGDEMDWYGILQIDQTADEATIKKQYKKFAFQFHPDKNKFPGAETAFKLIAEAQRVLLDKGKRSMHDMKRKASMGRPAAPYQPSPMADYSNMGTESTFGSTFRGSNFQHQRTQQSAQSGPTFWTMCPFCTVRYQYYRKIINKSIVCQTCKKPFVAYERGERSFPLATNLGQPAFCKKKDIPSQGDRKFEQEFKGTPAADGSQTLSHEKTGHSSDFSKEKMNGRRGRKRAVESSESGSTASSSDSEVDVAVDKSGDFHGAETFGCNTVPNRRRSSRRKQKVSYNETLSDDDDLVSHPKRFKGSGSSYACGQENGDESREEPANLDNQSVSAAAVGKEHNAVEQTDTLHFGENLSNVDKYPEKESGNKTTEKNGYVNRSGTYASVEKKRLEAVDDSKSDSSSGSLKDPVVYDCPDPDFNDFEKNKKEECFKVGQTWAIYDSDDAMPRFYARIRKIFYPGFKLKITWLEPDADDEKEMEWVNKRLPFSCGKFKFGNTETTEDRLIFSHLVPWEKGRGTATCKVYPRKGEVWGLFKSWDYKWISEEDTNRKYDYEFVEILSDYTEGVGTSVVQLVKVKGFVSVFCGKGNEGTDSILIPPAELLRFSHSVPSFKLTGEEREGVMKGFFELDPASLPPKLEEIDVSENLKEEAGGTHFNGYSSIHQEKVKKTCLNEDDRSLERTEDRTSPASNAAEIEFPDPEFFNFDAVKSMDRLQGDQIWSLYSEEDGLPKYYGKIEKIESDPDCKLYLRWLESSSLPNNTIQWHDKDMPICCGSFKILTRGKLEKFSSSATFSHMVSAEPVGKKNEYNIFPKNGEIWALYKNWNARMKCSDLENCDYDVVEVVEARNLQIEALLLERVAGFNSVFKPKREAASAVMIISIEELLRFSHQVPAYKLKEERDGFLRGCWELDTAALPVRYFLP